MRRWRDEVGPAQLCAVVRVGLGLLLADETLTLWRALHADAFPAAFHWPLVPDALVAPPALLSALAAAQLILALLIVTGAQARVALLGAALFQLYLLSIDRLAYHNYRYTFALALLLTSLTPCDRALRRGRPAGDGPLWAQRLLQLQVSIVYLSSGGSKLLDGDWRAGRVIADGVVRFSALAVAKGAPAWAVTMLGRAAVAGALAKLTIATELFLGLGLWSRRLRAPALWVGVLFHLFIQLTTTVAIFSWLMILLYALFARPALQERVVRYDERRQRRQIRLLAALDWLRRFRFEPAASFALTDRDGQVTVGIAALAGVARATPLLFVAWPPLWIWARLSAGSARHAEPRARRCGR